MSVVPFSGPRSLLSPDPRPASERPASRFLSESECAALAHRVTAMAVGGGDTGVLLESSWLGALRFARNEIMMSSDVRENDVHVVRDVRGAQAGVTISQIDDIALHAAVRRAERTLWTKPEIGDGPFEEHFVVTKPRSDDGEGRGSTFRFPEAVTLLTQTPEPYSKPHIFFDTTYNLDASHRLARIQPFVAAMRAQDLRAAGYIQVSAHGRAVMDTQGRSLYYPYTRAQFSVTVRERDDTGSGWAGVDWSDWTRIDVEHLTQVAIDKCLRSRNPVAVEPGRYTAILEPQAVCDLFTPVVRELERVFAESGNNVFSAPTKGDSKIGERVFDERLTVSADPMDPDLGFPPFDQEGNVYHPVTWIERGILRELAYERSYGIQQLGKNSGLPNSGAYRLSGGTTTIDEMIAATTRGILVTRFSGVAIVDPKSLLCTGYTRDGLWLVEHGKISKAIKNFRFTESPMFAFNNVEAVGVPTRVFRPGAPTVVPPITVRDFNFSSLVEAV